MTTAVIIAGDFRTIQHSIKSANSLLQDSDIFVSVWRDSNFCHKIKPEQTYSYGSITKEQVHQYLHPHNVVDIEIEDHDQNHWFTLGYNSDFLHRLRRGIDMMRASGKEYTSVLFMRPDLFFGHNTHLLKDAIEQIQPGQFVTILSNEHRVNVNRTLNDTLFATHVTDVDSAVPTVELFQNHKHEDWHTFYRNFVVNNGLQVKNVEQFQCLILRPPTRDGMSFADVMQNSEAWDDMYIINTIEKFGLKKAVADWSDTGVSRIMRARGENTALVVFGQSRYFSASKLSLPIWNASHRYLLTWDEGEARTYADILKPDDAFFVNEENLPASSGQFTDINAFRMFFLLSQIKSVPNIYDTYILIRPDIFYWKVDDLPIEASKHVQTLSGNLDWCNDQLFVLTKYGKYVLEHVFDSALEQSQMHVHTFLANFFKKWNIDFVSTDLINRIQPYIQREGFVSLPDDDYNFETAMAVFNHSATWWRRTYGRIYQGIPPKLNAQNEAQR